MGKISLPQYGGEGQSDYKGQKSDMKTGQPGGEGGGKEGKIPAGSKGTDMLLKTIKPDYNGPGRFLKTA